MTLTKSPAEIIQAMLVAESGALFSDPDDNLAWPLYVSSMPDGTGIPDDCGAIFDTRGRLLHRLLTSGKQIQSYGVQIKTRAINYGNGYTRLAQIFKEFTKVSRRNVMIGIESFLIDTIMPSSPVISAGQDERRRAFATVNFLILFIEGVD